MILVAWRESVRQIFSLMSLFCSSEIQHGFCNVLPYLPPVLLSVRVCRKSWKADWFTEVREDQTINFRNRKLRQSMSPQCPLMSDKGSHWDTPTKGRRFNYCNLYFKCNDLHYPSWLKTWIKQSMAVFPSMNIKHWTSGLFWVVVCFFVLFVGLFGF